MGHRELFFSSWAMGHDEHIPEEGNGGGGGGRKRTLNLIFFPVGNVRCVSLASQVEA
jgi:hypothetical protein